MFEASAVHLRQFVQSAAMLYISLPRCYSVVVLSHNIIMFCCPNKCDVLFEEIIFPNKSMDIKLPCFLFYD